MKSQFYRAQFTIVVCYSYSIHRCLLYSSILTAAMLVAQEMTACIILRFNAIKKKILFWDKYKYKFLPYFLTVRCAYGFKDAKISPMIWTCFSIQVVVKKYKFDADFKIRWESWKKVHNIKTIDRKEVESLEFNKNYYFCVKGTILQFFHWTHNQLIILAFWQS